MKTYDINNDMTLYGLNGADNISTNRIGYPPLPEHELLDCLSRAMRPQKGLEEAIKNMREMLGLPSSDGPSVEDVIGILARIAYCTDYSGKDIDDAKLLVKQYRSTK